MEPAGAGCARLCPEPGTDNVSTHSTGIYLGVYYPLVLCKTHQVVKKSTFDLTKVLSVEGTRTKAPLWPGVAVVVSQHRGFLEETPSAGKELAAAGWVGQASEGTSRGSSSTKGDKNLLALFQILPMHLLET